MPIPESQLVTWSHMGAVARSKATHESIRTALLAETSPVTQKRPVVCLQGSYRNTTNIRGDSDVDILVELENTFRRDLSELSLEQRLLYRQVYESATYLLHHFRGDVLKALRAHYGPSAVSEGSKSLKVAGGASRLPADVVPCLQYRRYHTFLGLEKQEYTAGIVFDSPSQKDQIINYPKLHYDNGVIKNSESRTNGWYKPTIRVFKNMRTYLADRATIEESLAPSYFLECLLYNVPDEQYGRTFADTICNVGNWLAAVDFSGFLCQSEQQLLFGDSPQQWSTVSASQFLDAVLDLWNTW